MNRTDQSAEPSMEEILASIRHIISDDDRNGSPGRAAAQSPRAANIPTAQTPPLSSLPEDDVLDLTDEFVFPEERVEPFPAANSSLSHEQDAPSEESHPAREDAHATSSPPSRPPLAAPGEPERARRPEAFRPPRQEAGHRPAPTGSRPVWSRRELPNPPAAAQSSVAGTRHEQAAPKPPKKNWAEDIQMPVPEEGPVSLISSGQGESRPHDSKRAQTGEREAGGAAQVAGRPSGFDRPQEAAVAALAEKIARSAVGAMDATELATAQRVDFEHIDEDHKAHVTEKFANAIQLDAEAQDSGPLPSLLDEVLRQDFSRELPPSMLPDEAIEPETRIPSRERADFPQPFPRRDKMPEPRVSSVNTASPAKARTEAAATQQPSESSMPDQSLAQAQFLGHAQPSFPAQGSRALEEAVREMLRPLLVQWLNEHMPRILENAIREEIATRGLLPKSNG
jgi:cell pole-organizing protein PopZ